MLKDTADFAESVELMMRKTLGIPLEEQVSQDTNVFDICKNLYRVFLIVVKFEWNNDIGISVIN
jgi:hypothetical protein